MEMQDVPRMSPEELYTRMAQGEAVVVLDVRTTDGLSVHPDQIPGTRWLPLAEVATALRRKKGAVAALLFRGMTRLRKQLAWEGEE